MAMSPLAEALAMQHQVQPNQEQVQPANVLGAYQLASQVAEQNYQAKIAQQNALWGGLASLGSAGVLGFGKPWFTQYLANAAKGAGNAANGATGAANAASPAAAAGTADATGAGAGAAADAGAGSVAGDYAGLTGGTVGDLGAAAGAAGAAGDASVGAALAASAPEDAAAAGAAADAAPEFFASILPLLFA